MKINVKYFAFYEDLLDRKEEQVEVGEGATVADLFNHVMRQYEFKDRLSTSTLFAVNQAYVPRDCLLKNGDEVAFIPPVAGG